MCSSPDDFISEVLAAKYRIKNELEKVTRRRIAMKVKGSIFGENPMGLEEPGRDHRGVRRYVGIGERLNYTLQDRTQGGGHRFFKLRKLGPGDFVPLPAIGKGAATSTPRVWNRTRQEGFVISARTEGWVEVYELRTPRCHPRERL